MQLIAWKDSSLKWPVMCQVGRQTLHTHSPHHGGVSQSIKNELIIVTQYRRQQLIVYVSLMCVRSEQERSSEAEHPVP